MNKTSKDLRLAVKEVYESQSVSFSDCYELEGLKKIRVIFVPSDAPHYVSKIAEFLQTKVKLKYPEINPEIITISSLFNKDSDWHEMTCKALSDAAQHLKEQNQAYGSQSVVLCFSDIVAEILIARQCLTKSYEECFIPKLICAVDDFKTTKGAFERAALRINRTNKMLYYEPYRQKIPTMADIMVVLASGYECWDDMMDLWHLIACRYGKYAKIAYIDDLEQWTSKEYANKIFAKFSWLVQKAKIADEVEKFPPYAYKIVEKYEGQNILFCLPQRKSYWVYNLQQAASATQNISFYIYEQEFNDMWSSLGPIGKQFFCQDMKNLEEATKMKKRLSGYKLNKRFCNWNLRLFWWNYKVCVKNYCWISFLSY